MADLQLEQAKVPAAIRKLYRKVVKTYMRENLAAALLMYSRLPRLKRLRLLDEVGPYFEEEGNDD